MANDIDGAFNCVNHDQLVDRMHDDKFPTDLIGIIRDFTSTRLISISFDRETERPAPYQSGLPQGSPLSQVLFIIYASALTKGNPSAMERSTSYVNDETTPQGATSPVFVSRILQTRLDEKIKRAAFLNIKYAPFKAEPMHLITLTSKSSASSHGILLYNTTVTPKETVKSLGVWLDHRLSVRIHAASARSRTRTNCSFLNQSSKRKGASPGAIHNLATTTTLPRMLSGSEVWWTGAD